MNRFWGGTASAVADKVGLHAAQPAAAKPAIDFAALTARLKPRPFKAKSKLSSTARPAAGGADAPDEH